LNEEFISSARIDNLFSSFAALNSILNPKFFEGSSFVNAVVLFDHEECGSQSFQGAESMFFFESLKRIFFNLKGNEEGWAKAIAKSFLISADMAHSIHPNYPEKHQQNHQVNNNLIFL
jgi:aspartyl aminopeptidase